jgi:HlyD family secretion protein
MNDLQTAPAANGTAPSLGERVRSLRLPERTEARGEKATSPWLPWALCLLLAGCSSSLLVRAAFLKPAGPDTPAPAAAASGGEKSPGAQSATPTAPKADPEPKEGETVLEDKGYFTPAHQISVSPIGVNGRIRELYVQEGKYFKAGETLAVIDSSEFEFQRDECIANAARNKAERERLLDPNLSEEKGQAKARLSRAQAELEAAELEYDRVNSLYSRGVVAKKEYDDARMTRDSRHQQVQELKEAQKLSLREAHPKLIAAAEAEARACAARLNLAEWRVGNCTIKAPVDGWVLSKKAEIGNLINAAFFSGSTSLCEMADLTDLEVTLDIQERDIRKVKEGGPVRIRPDAWPDRVYEGKVDRIMPIADRSKGSVEVRVKVLPRERLREEEGRYLKPNLKAVVTFLADKPAKDK